MPSPVSTNPAWARAIGRPPSVKATTSRPKPMIPVPPAVVARVPKRSVSVPE
jgi:hypothetical protein